MIFYDLIQACLEEKTNKGTLALIKAEEWNGDIKDIFKLMLDKSIIYNIKKVPILDRDLMYKQSIKTDFALVTEVKSLLYDDLRGNALKQRIQKIYNCCDEKRGRTLVWILDKNNPAKVGKTMVNKVWPGLIRVQEYMGAVPGTLEALEKLPWETGVNCQIKEDGMAVLVSYYKGEPKELRTRQGQNITKYFPEFFQSLAIMSPSFNSTVHHELFVWDTEDEVMLDRKTGNGLINKQVKNGKVGGSVDSSIRSVILDIYNSKTQSSRYFICSALVTKISRLVRQKTIMHLSEARAWAQEVIQAGGEGLICKHPEKPFKQDKPAWNVKIKNEFEVELRVIGFKKHSKNSSQIGSLLCRSEDDILEVSVGSGLTDFQRSVDPMVYIGLIVSVKAESVIKSKGKKKPSLYLPRFSPDEHGSWIRRDKDKADTYKEIKDQEAASRLAKEFTC